MGDHLQNPVPTNPISPEVASEASGFFANVTNRGKALAGKVEAEGLKVKESVGEDITKQGTKFQGFKGNVMAFKASKTAEAQAALDGIQAKHAENVNAAKAELAQGGIHERGAKALGTWKKWGEKGVETYNKAVAEGGDLDRAKAEFKQGKEQAEAEAKAKADAEAQADAAKSLPQAPAAGGRRRRGRKSRRKKKSFKKHYMWNTRGKRYMAKTYKQHLKGLKLGHTHKKPKKRKTRKKKRRRNRKKSRRRRRR